MTAMKVVEMLKSVLCDPEGKCCITGSDGDRRVVDDALAMLSAVEPAPDGLVESELAGVTLNYYDGKSLLHFEAVYPDGNQVSIFSVNKKFKAIADLIFNCVNHRAALTSRAAVDGQPVAWVRFCSDGTYEGPLMDCAIEDVRKKSGAWTPLYKPASRAAVLEEAAKNDTERLDYLDALNAEKNSRIGTTYGWRLSENHNRIALEDHNYPPLNVRAAIDAAIRAAKGE